MQFLKFFILEGGGVPPKHVGVNRRLYCCTCSMCICWFYTEKSKSMLDFFILNFRRVLIVVSFLLGKSPASVYYCMPTFLNSLSVPSSNSVVEHSVLPLP